MLQTIIFPAISLSGSWVLFLSDCHG